MPMTSIPLDQLPQGQEIRRDGYGRYMVVPPNGGRPMGYTRATTVANTLDDTGGLAPWKSSMTAAGIIMRRGLRSRWESLLAQYGDPWYHSEESKKLCKELVEECAAVGGSNDRKEIGSSLHQISALVDLGRTPTHLSAETERDIKAYTKGLEYAGIEIVNYQSEPMVEVMVVLDEYQVAGQFDRLVKLPRFDLPMVAELKTGSSVEYSWGPFAVQLAIYSRANAIYKQGVAPDGSEDRRIQMPTVSKQHGLIMWLNAGTGEIEFYILDLDKGWEAFSHSMWTRGWRNAKPYTKLTAMDLVPQLQASIDRVTGEITDGTGQVTAERDSQTPADASHSPVAHTHNYDRVLLGGGIACTICDEIEPESEKQLAAISQPDLERTTQEEIDQARELEQEVIAEIRVWLQDRINVIGRNQQARIDLSQLWPENVPTLRASNDHTPEQLAAIEELLDGVERRWEIEFPSEPKPGSPQAQIVSLFPGSKMIDPTGDRPA